MKSVLLLSLIDIGESWNIPTVDTLNEQIDKILDRFSKMAFEKDDAYWGYGQRSAGKDMRAALGFVRRELGPLLKQPVTIDDVPKVLAAIRSARECFIDIEDDEYGFGAGMLTDLSSAVSALVHR